MESTDLGDLLARWLNEIVFLVQNRGFVPTKISLSPLSPEGLVASLAGWEAKRLPLQVEVKSATRHKLSVKKARQGWRAAVILDV